MPRLAARVVLGEKERLQGPRRAGCARWLRSRSSSSRRVDGQRSVRRHRAGASSPSPRSRLPRPPGPAMLGYVSVDVDRHAGLASEALDASALAAVLTEAGFEGGVDRRFTARARRLTEVVGRVLRFGSAEGADGTSRGSRTTAPTSRSEAKPAIPRTSPAPSLPTGLSGCCTKDSSSTSLHGPAVPTWSRCSSAVRTRSTIRPPIAQELDARVGRMDEGCTSTCSRNSRWTRSPRGDRPGPRRSRLCRRRGGSDLRDLHGRDGRAARDDRRLHLRRGARRRGQRLRLRLRQRGGDADLGPARDLDGRPPEPRCASRTTPRSTRPGTCT